MSGCDTSKWMIQQQQHPVILKSCMRIFQPSDRKTRVQCRTNDIFSFSGGNGGTEVRAFVAELTHNPFEKKERGLPGKILPTVAWQRTCLAQMLRSVAYSIKMFRCSHFTCLEKGKGPLGFIVPLPCCLFPFHTSFPHSYIPHATAAMATSTPTIICRVKAIYPFHSDEPASLNFNKDDYIDVLAQLESGWWDGW